MKATHKVTTYENMNELIKETEPVDFARLAVENTRKMQEEKDNLLQLDWSLSLLISLTDFGFDEMIKQMEQAERLDCTETEELCKKILRTKFPASYRDYLETDSSSADGSDNR